MTIKVTKSLSLSDYIAANWLYQRKYWLPYGLLKIYAIGVPVFFVVMLIATAIDESIDRSIVWDLFLCSLIFGLIMVVVLPLICAIKMLLFAKRHFREMSLDAPTSYQFDDQGLRGANDEGTFNLQWNRLYDFVQARRELLIRRTRRIIID